MTQPNNNKPGMNFSADEYVMAYHGPLLYDALVSITSNCAGKIAVLYNV